MVYDPKKVGTVVNKKKLYRFRCCGLTNIPPLDPSPQLHNQESLSLCSKLLGHRNRRIYRWNQHWTSQRCRN